LSDVLGQASHMTESRAIFPADERRWEVYAPLPNGGSVLTITGTSPTAPTGEIVSVYVISPGTMANRLKRTDHDGNAVLQPVNVEERG
jgi:hypothetical protein